jgi:hypothetical protein
MQVIGVDIGAKGGIAVYDGQRFETWQATRDRPLWQLAMLVREQHSGLPWYVEAPIDVAHGQRSERSIGRGLGQLDVAIHGVSRFDVHPSRWQSALGLRGLTKAQKKAAAEKISGCALGEGAADAVLIALYAWRLRDTMSVTLRG